MLLSCGEHPASVLSGWLDVKFFYESEGFVNSAFVLVVKSCEKVWKRT